MTDKHLSLAQEIAEEVESIEGIEWCNVDDYNNSKSEFSMFAGYEEDANLHSVSQLVRNTLENSELNIRCFYTPSQARRDWYDFELTSY
jgi:uncharacterized metal-binding protein